MKGVLFHFGFNYFPLAWKLIPHISFHICLNRTSEHLISWRLCWSIVFLIELFIFAFWSQILHLKKYICKRLELTDTDSVVLDDKHVCFSSFSTPLGGNTLSGWHLGSWTVAWLHSAHSMAWSGNWIHPSLSKKSSTALKQIYFFINMFSIQLGWFLYPRTPLRRTAPLFLHEQLFYVPVSGLEITAMVIWFTESVPDEISSTVYRVMSST